MLQMQGHGLDDKLRTGNMHPFPPVRKVSDDWQETHSALAPYNDKTETVTKSNPWFMFTEMGAVFCTMQEWMAPNGFVWKEENKISQTILSVQTLTEIQKKKRAT